MRDCVDCVCDVTYAGMAHVCSIVYATYASITQLCIRSIQAMTYTKANSTMDCICRIARAMTRSSV